MFFFKNEDVIKYVSENEGMVGVVGVVGCRNRLLI
jgi:hypothetical protein